MTIKLLAIGKTDSTSLQNLISEYENRLKYYIKFQLEIIPDIKNVKNLSEAQQKEKEGEFILKKLNATDVLILLDENGKQFDSIEFSNFLQKKMNSGRMDEGMVSRSQQLEGQVNCESNSVYTSGVTCCPLVREDNSFIKCRIQDEIVQMLLEIIEQVEQLCYDCYNCMYLGVRHE